MNLLKLHRQSSSCSDYRNNNLTLVILIKPRSKLLKNAKNIPAFPKPKSSKISRGCTPPDHSPRHFSPLSAIALTSI